MLRVSIQLDGEAERRVLVTAAKHNLTPEAVVECAVRDLYVLIDRLTEQERARIYAGAMMVPGFVSRN